jgi:hypothetical protein
VRAARNENGPKTCLKQSNEREMADWLKIFLFFFNIEQYRRESGGHEIRKPRYS